MMSSPLYKVANWESLFESSETRKLVDLKWVRVPNKHDGLGFRKVAARPNSCELLAAWYLMLQIASRGKRGERGSLSRGGQPLTAGDLAIMTGFPEAIFESALPFFSDRSIGWLEVSGGSPGTLAESAAIPGESPDDLGDFQDDTQCVEYQQPPAMPGESPGAPGESPGRREGKGIEGREGVPPVSPPLGGGGNSNKAAQTDLPGIDSACADKKGRKRETAVDHPDADRIYQAYPRKVDPIDAKRAISRAIARSSVNHLLDRTTRFADEVDGCDRKFIPYPASWFNAGGYDSDPEEWSRIGRDGSESENNPITPGTASY